jgi:hypothetical protein
MMSRILALTAAACLVVFAGAALADKVEKADEKKADDTKAGTFVSFKDGKLTWTNKDGKEVSAMLAKDAKITCDGEKCKPEDLKKGIALALTMAKEEISEVKATTEKKDKEVKDKK